MYSRLLVMPGAPPQALPESEEKYVMLEFMEPLLRILESRDPVLTRPQYSAAQGAPGVSPSTPTEVISAGRGRGNLIELLSSEERRRRSHQLNPEYLALKSGSISAHHQVCGNGIGRQRDWG